MRLFGKKKEENVTSCVCNGNAVAIEAENISCCYSDSDACCCYEDACCKETNKKISSVKVLGSGCKSCHQLFENAQEAVQSMGSDIEVEYIIDMKKVVSYGAMSMPALVLNEKVVAMGKVLKADEVVALFHKIGF